MPNLLTKTNRKRRALNWLSELISPPECVCCSTLIDEELANSGENWLEASGFRLCPVCIEQVVSTYHRCQKCAFPVPEVVPNEDCLQCRKEKWHFDRVLTLGPYRDLLSQLTVQTKKPHQGPLRHALAGMMAWQLDQEFRGDDDQKEPQGNCLVVPVPNYWTHSFSGAANTAGHLARVVARQSNLPLAPAIVRRVRKTGKQGMLSWTERKKNVKGAFQIASPEQAKSKHIILVDDVITSGATCGEIALRLKQCGVHRVTVLVVARGVGSKEAVLVESSKS